MIYDATNTTDAIVIYNATVIADATIVFDGHMIADATMVLDVITDIPTSGYSTKRWS